MPNLFSVGSGSGPMAHVCFKPRMRGLDSNRELLNAWMHCALGEGHSGLLGVFCLSASETTCITQSSRLRGDIAANVVSVIFSPLWMDSGHGSMISQILSLQRCAFKDVYCDSHVSSSLLWALWTRLFIGVQTAPGGQAPLGSAQGLKLNHRRLLAGAYCQRDNPLTWRRCILRHSVARCAAAAAHRAASIGGAP